MRYPPNHKQATRRRILAAAGRKFREQGVAGAGVNEVMRQAGLTVGGFYAHFRSKDELVAETCLEGFSAALENLDRIARLPNRSARVRLLVDSYLSVHHRDDRGDGCLVAALSADLARAGPATRARYAGGLRTHLQALADALRLHPDPRVNRERTVALLGALLGALLLARTLEGEEGYRNILLPMRRRLRREFAEGPAEAVRTSTPQPQNDFLMAHAQFCP